MKRFLWVALSLTMVLATACQGASQPATDAPSASTTDQAPSGDSIGDANQDLVLLHTSVQNVANRYSSKLNPGQVEDAVIDGMAKSVGDCHTVYFTSRQFSLQIASMQGQMQFGGIGASLRK